MIKEVKKNLFYDLGIRNSLLKDFRPPSKRPDKGSIYETFVLLEMMPRLRPNMEIRFWRTKKQDEVDFVLIKDRVPIPIEVKAGAGLTTVPNGIRAFCRKYPESTDSFIVSMSKQETIEQDGVHHRFISFEQLEEMFEEF